MPIKKIILLLILQNLVPGKGRSDVSAFDLRLSAPGPRPVSGILTMPNPAGKERI